MGSFWTFLKLLALWVPCMSTVMPYMCNNWQLCGGAVHRVATRRRSLKAKASRGVWYTLLLVMAS